MINQPKVFCAIDTPDIDLACRWAAEIGPVLGGLKLGLEFFNAHGPRGVEKILMSAKNAALFMDLKFHDIPNTVAGAVQSICSNFDPAYLNVHAVGGLEMMRAAKEACGKQTKLLAVTVLTSMNDQDLKQTGVHSNVESQVQGLTEMALQAKLDGVVCSAFEIEKMRSCFGPSLVLMVPGIRPEGAEKGDQKRVMTPKEAMDAGATHLVIGRPITGAADPVATAQSIINSIS